MSKKATEFQKKEMSKMYRGKEIFKPLNTGWIDEHVACVREWVANIFFYRKGDSVIMIDAGYNYDRLEEKMGWLGLDPKAIKHILITHQDTDHVGAVEADSLGLLAARQNIKLDYGILGSSDLDQASKLTAKLQTELFLPLIYPFVRSGSCKIYNLDFPEVIKVRNELLPAGEREENVPCDLNDTAWFERIDASGGAVFFAAGVFYYFLKEQVRSLVCKMADAFPGGVLVFDAANKKAVKLMLKTWIKDVGSILCRCRRKGRVQPVGRAPFGLKPWLHARVQRPHRPLGQRLFPLFVPCRR